MEAEECGESFSEIKLTAARSRTWEAVHLISSKLEIGMSESDAYDLALRTLKELGAEKNWHRPQIRFGANTVRSFGESSQQDVPLQDDSLYFIDIGPVWDGHEGDAGQTFATGNNLELRRCAADCEQIYRLTESEWIRSETTGPDLYHFAEEQAARLGWILTLKGASGHRISDFPHALYHRGRLMNFEGQPAPQRWILEIQIRHPSQDFGAFFEDMLGVRTQTK